MMPVNPKSLVNLKPFTEGLSGNPLGRPKAIRFRKMLETVLMAEQEVLEGEAKVWKDIWSAGQGVGAIHDIPTMADLCARLAREYREAITGLTAESMIGG